MTIEAECRNEIVARRFTRVERYRQLIYELTAAIAIPSIEHSRPSADHIIEGPLTRFGGTGWFPYCIASFVTAAGGAQR